MSRECQTTYNPQRETRNRLAERGAAVLSTTELLGLVLGTGATKAPLEVAEQLLTTHRGLVAIAQLGVFGLASQPGMGEAKAAQLAAALELGIRLVGETGGKAPQIRSPEDAAAWCLPDMGLLEQEHMRVVFLDTRNRVTGTQDVFVGTAQSVDVRIADLFRDAIRRNSTGVVLAHNHPSGDPSPSAEDYSTTKRIIDAGKLLDIPVKDHLVIGRGSFVSLRERFTELQWE